MKNALIIAFLLLSTIASATDYYISSSGNDTNNGLSSSTPWKTIAKVNSAFLIINPGDRILFNRGDTFYGTITIAKSGSAGNPIVIGAYGTGAKPVITGFTTVNEWTDLGGNIWESSSKVSMLSTCNMVKINGVNTAMGRYPNTGYLTYQSHSGDVSITSNSLSGTPDWTGAELVLRKNRFIIDRSNITTQSGGTLTHSATGPNYVPIDGFGFFIQNDIRTLDVANEWYYNPSTKKISVYSTNSPTNLQISTLDNLVFINEFNGLTFDGIEFTGSNMYTFFIFISQNIKIHNCNFNFSGTNAISAYFSSHIDIVKSSFNHTNNSTLNITSFGNTQYPTEHILVSENTIRNTYTLAGMGKKIDGQADRSAILLVGSNSTIEKCVIDSTGYIPIWWLGDSFLVQNNFITNFCFIKDDGGGIYTNSYDDYPIEYTNQRVLNNIVLNGIGALEGSGNPTSSVGASGIYVDQNSSNIEISGNTVANCRMFYGLLISASHLITIKNNTSYNNRFQIFLYSDDYTKGHGYSYMRNVDIKKNIFLAKTSGQVGLRALNYHNDIGSWGAIDSNYYARPIDDDSIFQVYTQSYRSFTNYTLAGWQTFSDFDTNSHRSSVTVADTADIDFYYNVTNTNKVITLYQPMIDVKGTKYFNSIILLPFTSVVLMVDPNPTNQPPVVEISNPLKGNEYKTNSTITLEAMASDPDGSISKVEFYNGPVKLVELTSAPYTFIWKYVKAGTYSITAIATDNLNAANTSLPVEFKVGANIKYDANSEIVNLYPNPNDGHFSIEFINPLQNEKNELVITDLAGKQVYNSPISKEETIKQIDLSYVKSGIYILMILYKGIFVTKKIIIN